MVFLLCTPQRSVTFYSLDFLLLTLEFLWAALVSFLCSARVTIAANAHCSQMAFTKRAKYYEGHEGILQDICSFHQAFACGRQKIVLQNTTRQHNHLLPLNTV